MGMPFLGPRGRTLAIAGMIALSVVLSVLAVRSIVWNARSEVTVERPGAAPPAGPSPGTRAPAFDVAGLAQPGAIRLAAFRGHPVVLNFWASWCPPCRAEAPVLEAAARRYERQGVVFVGIDMPTDWGPDAATFVRRHHITYRVGRDDDGRISRAYRVTGLPTTYFIGADGRITGPAEVGGFLGDAGARTLASQIEQVLHQKGISR